MPVNAISQVSPYRLYVLGRIGLLDEHDDELSAVLAQPKRLALLAFLAMGSGRGPIRRDKLLGVFWPELTDDRARRALNKSIHFLRQALGDAAVVSRGDEELLVDPRYLWCDACAFDAAVAREDPEGALALYGGEILPAFYIEEAPLFDEWLENERSRLRRAAGGAAQIAAVRREQAGDLAQAVEIARRAAQFADDDERAERLLLELLDRQGDRTGALHEYERFAQRLATDFAAEPAPETRALIDRVRQRSETALQPTDGSRLVWIASALSKVEVGDGKPTFPRRRIAAAVAVLVVVAVLIVAATIHSKSSGQPKWVLVADFESPPDHRATAIAIRELVSSALDESRVVATVARGHLMDARRAAGIPDSSPLVAQIARHVAYRSAVRIIVDGRIDKVGSTYSLIVRALDVTNDRVMASRLGAATEDSIIPAVTRLGRRIRADLEHRNVEALHVTTPLERSTASFEAYKLLVTANDVFERESKYGAATPLLRQAVAIDSTFAAGWQALAENWWQSGGPAGVAYERAMSYADRLTPYERLLLEGSYARQITGDPQRAATLFARATHEMPYRAEAYILLATALRDLAQYDDALRSEYRARSLLPFGPSRDFNVNFIAFLAPLGRIAEARSVAAKATGHDRRGHEVQIAISTADVDFLGRVMPELLAEQNIDAFSRRHNAFVGTSLLAASGRVHDALAALDLAPSRDGGERRRTDLTEALLKLATGIPSQSPFSGELPDSVVVRHGATAALLGDTSALRHQLERAQPDTLAPSSPRLRDLRTYEALIAYGAHRWTDVIRLVGQGAWRGEQGRFWHTLVLRRWLVADAYERLGRPDSAAAFFETIVTPTRSTWIEDLPKAFAYPYAQRRLALLYEQMGDKRRARGHWLSFLKTVKHPDPELRPLVNEARKALRL